MKKFLLPLVLLFSFAIPAVAQAHTVNFSAVCGKATFSWALFTPGGNQPGNDGNMGYNTPSYSLSFEPATGGTPTTASGNAHFNTAATTVSVTLPAVNGTITQASSSWTSAQTTDGNHNAYSISNVRVTGCPTTTTTTTTSSTTSTPTTSTTTSTTSTTSTTTTTPTTSTTTSSTTSTPTTSTSSTTSTPTTTATTSVTTSSSSTPPPGTGGVLPFTSCVATKVTLAKTKIASNRQFTAVVRGSGIKRVVFYVDGHKVKTLTKPNSGKTGFAYTVPVSAGRYGTHTLATKTTTNCGNPKTNTLSYSRLVPARAVVPKFTG